MVTKNIQERYPLLPAFVVFVFLALLSRDWGLCSHWRGRDRKGKRMDLQCCGEESLVQEVRQFCPLPPRHPAYQNTWPKQHMCNSAGHRRNMPEGSMPFHWLLLLNCLPLNVILGSCSECIFLCPSLYYTENLWGPNEARITLVNSLSILRKFRIG